MENEKEAYLINRVINRVSFLASDKEMNIILFEVNRLQSYISYRTYYTLIREGFSDGISVNPSILREHIAAECRYENEFISDLVEIFRERFNRTLYGISIPDNEEKPNEIRSN
jgi:hypothetical protein